MTTQHRGSCLCGSVRFTVNGALRQVVFCHCGQCRKQTGLYYASTNASNSDLKIDGEENITWYHSSDKGRRGFCSKCGSALFWRYEGLEVTSIQAGSLEMPTGLTPGYHIFCADKGDFYEINDGLPQYERSSPAIVTEE